MSQLKVIVNRLNKRKNPITDFSDKTNIAGVVSNGFTFESANLITNNLGKWHVDRDGYYYWGGGVISLDVVPNISTNIKNLPSNLPSNFRVGIDISHHNQLSDWTAFINAGVVFTYIKISEGVGTPDLKAKQHAALARKNGFKIGYYHFCRPDTRNGGTVISDAMAEADEAIGIANDNEEPHLPLVLDLEDQVHWDTPLKPSDYLLWINTFIDRVKEKSGLECMIYSRKEYLDRKLPHDHDLGKYKLWISRYDLNDTNKVICPIGWRNWTMWQYCEHGIIGTNLELDINILKDSALF